MSKIYGLSPALVKVIEVSKVQLVASYGAEIWWRNRNEHQNEIQKLINQQYYLITGIYPGTPISAVTREFGLIFEHVSLDFRRLNYMYRLVSFPDLILAKNILLLL